MELNSTLQEAVARVAEVKARRAAEKQAKEAEKKAFWDKYNEQLAKSTPNQGGAHSKSSRVYRIW